MKHLRAVAVGICAVLASHGTGALAQDDIDLPPMEPADVATPPPAEPTALPDADTADHAPTNPPAAAPSDETAHPSLEPSQAVSDSGPSVEIQRGQPRTPSEEEDELVLSSPTRSVDDYEEARKRVLHRRTLPQYSVNFTVEPKAFAKVDLRTPTHSTTAGLQDPNLLGLMLGYDHTVYKRQGLALLGVDGGIYSSTEKDPYSGLMTAFAAISPHAQYQALFIPRQWVVPTIKLGAEFLRYSYSLENHKVSGFRVLPRFELGLLFFLNILEPSSAGQMQQNYGVQRTYLATYYTVATDSSKTDFDLSESTFRVGLRFEH